MAYWNQPMSDPFDAVVCEGPAGSRLAVSGEVDLATAPKLAQLLSEYAGTTDGDVVVDASRVSFLDSSGVAVLVDCVKVLARTGRQLVIRDAPPFLCRVLDVTGVSAYLYLDASAPITGAESNPSGRLQC